MSDPQPFRISISASFTAEPVAPVLAFWGEQLDAVFEVQFSPYNQILQTLLDPGSEFARNGHGVNVVLLRLQDLSQFHENDRPPTRLDENSADLVRALRSAAGRFTVPLIVCLCPSQAETIETELSQELSGIPGVQVIDHRKIQTLYPVGKLFDPEADRLAKVPYSEEWFAALGTTLARQIAALSLAPYKVIALDCDNTLWEGICGEDGPAGVRLDPARRTLQEFLLEQREAGVVLCLASKNNLEDVLETFRLHPEMPLQLPHFTTHRINWEPKAENLAAMAEELGVGLDSFVLVDDSPKECAEVDEAAPEVLTLTLPEDVSRIPHLLQHVWAFDHPVTTEADRQRAASYTQQQEFGRAFHSVHSLEEFMRGLDLRVEIEPMAAHQLARVTQLTQRTNQFNCTGVRRSEAEIHALLQNGWECLTVNVQDRFGDYGLVGAVLFHAAGPELVVENFLLSCRALGRGVEHQMAAHLGSLAQLRGLDPVSFVVIDTGKNQPALRFLESLRDGPSSEDRRFAAQELAKVTWKPAAASIGPVPHRKPQATNHRSLPFVRIANELSTPAQILRAMRTVPAEAAHSASMTATESALAAIWSDLLKTPTVRPEDRFFDLGGHSLLAILLVSRVRDQFGVELSIDDVYSGSLTLRDLAATIEAARLTGVAPDEYDALLAEIEGLSDEEVRALLEQEDPESLRS